MRLPNRLQTTIAVGLASAWFAGCGPSASVEVQHGRNTLPNNVGAKVLDGCNLRQAEREIRQRVLDRRSFWADTITDRRKMHLNAIVSQGSEIIGNPIELKCGKKTVAYAGIEDPLRARRDHSFDPVRVIKAEAEGIELTAVGTGPLPKFPLSVKATKLRLGDPGQAAAQGPDYVLGFEAGNNVFGLMLLPQENIPSDPPPQSGVMA